VVEVNQHLRQSANGSLPRSHSQTSHVEISKHEDSRDHDQGQNKDKGVIHNKELEIAIPAL